MVQKQMQSVADVARLLEVHAEVVLEYAERNELPRVGRELVFSPRDVRDCERWVNAASAAEADVSDDADEDEDDDDDEASDDDADDTSENGDEDDDNDENEDDDKDEE